LLEASVVCFQGLSIIRDGAETQENLQSGQPLHGENQKNRSLRVAAKKNPDRLSNLKSRALTYYVVA
jgi:hypothetical protein